MKIYTALILTLLGYSNINYAQNSLDSTRVEIPPPPSPPTECIEEEPFMVVENMPRFIACEDSGLKKKKLQQCADKALLEFVYHNLKYPKKAEENNITGTAVIQFTVLKTGQVANTKIVKNLGGGCGKEALRVVKMLPDFIPGKQRGRSVHVVYNLPIVFGLK